MFHSYSVPTPDFGKELLTNCGQDMGSWLLGEVAFENCQVAGKGAEPTRHAKVSPANLAGQ